MKIRCNLTIVRTRKLMLPLVLSLSCLGSVTASAQTTKTQHELPWLRFANVDTAHPTCDQVLSDPTLIACSGCKVDEFYLTILPKGKDVYGPFFNHGGRLTEKQIEILKRFKDSEVAIRLELVRVDVPEGMKRSIPGIVINCNK